MRITTYEKGGNSLNPFIKLSIFLIIILCLFVMPVSAFEDNFNDEDITDWGVDSGSWTVENSSSINGVEDFYLYSGTIIQNAPAGTTTEEIHYTTDDSDHNYIEFNFRTSAVSTGNGWAQQTFKFSDNGSAYRALYIYSNVVTTSLRGSGFTYSNVALNKGVWYKAEISINEETNSVTIGIYDTTGNEINMQTIAYTKIDNPTHITVIHAAHSSNYDAGRSNFYIDNIYTSNILPTTVTDISWTSSTYYLDDTGIYSYVIESDFWSFLYKYRVQILKNDVEIDTIKVGQIGTRYYDMDDVGTYQIKLQYSGYIFTNWVSLDTDYTNVLTPEDSYINVPQTTAIKTNFTATYMYGTTPISPIINIKVLQNDYTYKVIDTKILPSATAGTTYTVNLSISSLSPIGYYVVELYDNGQGKSFATDTIQTTYAYIPPSDVVLSSYVNTTNNVYSLGGIISGSYAIDDTNYTDYYTKLQVYNIDKDIISFSFIPLHQVDNFDIPITNSELDFYSDGVNRYPISTNFLSGENAVRLASYNTDGSLNEVITQKNITLSIINDEGYGLTLSKYIVDETEIFAIKAITPVQANIVIHPLTLMGISDITILINGSTQMSYAIGIADTYTISLVSGGETKITQIIKVFEGEEIIAPIDEDEVIPDTTFQDNTTSLLNSPYLIGLFIMCVFLAIGATNGIGGTIVTGSIGLGIVCYMGIFPWILLVIEILVVAALMAKGMINLAGD